MKLEAIAKRERELGRRQLRTRSGPAFWRSLRLLFRLLKMEIELLFGIFLVASNFIYGVHSTVFTIKNNCPHVIAPATLTGKGDSVLTGFELAPQA
ncbi:hypothetical protein L6452_08787 [Arctium lappa]|uniref:Uncharacterized protein n=1 Tax=Arctium lappa TaxID=4217 RepID=A0ACB9DIK4_ARCLA|nr:hypothetical protein L6452_08787 [Arctium lappa]